MQQKINDISGFAEQNKVIQVSIWRFSDTRIPLVTLIKCKNDHIDEDDDGGSYNVDEDYDGVDQISTIFSCQESR